nr:cytoplasmic tRNA 2-thiolation protein 2-A-like [Procambarus clarkii]XP_045625548.1 cytoplasmic tRNA 2-thiolation protein 2-A-like [Procambarus clarkii]XP_045625549.1 cytoplasmic tRNA 2-thiolation protein 2-A-like [Procambarus clarkii]XP_045625550.1 cytoplasmic tRNA 2-thiolation protein 2-A-like [Procambarus clarkii]XP_045625551.1 cytoplasmic tRNA 2-thiolation protein 2-A-like [Procambarus clarkii]XP_045625552.1 cytoplasmic tRNA 2-thiolation protein 2-A-like [Procambarus clarkii]
MCSIDPDEITAMERVTGALDISGGEVLCRKCGESTAEVVLRVKDAYCRQCFLLYFVHKFRSTIGKSKQIHPGDRVLVAISGGPSSVALLHLIREGLNENSHKKLRFEPAFLYVDESCISGDPMIGLDYVRKVCSEVIAVDFQCYVTSLQQIMLPNSHPPVPFTEEWSEANLLNSKSATEKLRELLASCKSVSAQQDLHEQLRHEVIVQCAQDLRYQKVFLADNSTKLSISILSNVAVGRGSQLSRKVHFRSLHRDVEVFRPMREILESEVQHYVRFHKLNELQSPVFKPKGTSIASCTEEFVRGLQKEFPATVPTIFRTGDKLTSSSLDNSKHSTPDMNSDSTSDTRVDLSSKHCVLCCSPVDTGQGEASAFCATLVSQKLSAGGSLSHSLQENLTNKGSDISRETFTDMMNGLHVNDCCEAGESSPVTAESLADGQTSECCGGRKLCSSGSKELEQITKDVMERHLCYGCRIVLREMVEVNRLPVKMRKVAAESERRMHMREQIQDFLL